LTSIDFAKKSQCTSFHPLILQKNRLKTPFFCKKMTKIPQKSHFANKSGHFFAKYPRKMAYILQKNRI